MFQTLAWFLSMILREARQAVTWTAAARGVSEEHPALQRWPASCFAAHRTAFTYAKAAWKSSQSQGALHKRVSVFTAPAEGLQVAVQDVQRGTGRPSGSVFPAYKQGGHRSRLKGTAGSRRCFAGGRMQVRLELLVVLAAV